MRCRRILFLFMLAGCVPARAETLRVDTLLSPPGWALLERELLRASSAACEEFFARFFDPASGALLCVERWGGDDGPDDASETMSGWPLLHSLGADDRILELYKKGWEGHLRQFTLAKTEDVPFARDGMYYKEFPCMFDWQHNNEGLLPFHRQGLSDPYDEAYIRRLRRFAGFYMNEDPGAPNYDPKYKVIRSLFNGSRGPLMRDATALDWTGDPIEVENRFDLRHGERNYEEMLAHFEDYTKIVGDHPLNLLSTSLATNAFLATGEEKYKSWVLEYVDAWRERMIENGNIIPSNVGLDGTLGGACDGKWYGGTYGWGFTVIVPQTGGLAHRNRQHWGFTGFMNAFLLTGDDRYLDVWRKQRAAVNAQVRIVDGQKVYPRMYGNDGWYSWVPERYSYNDLEIYFLSMAKPDRDVLGDHPWLLFLEGKNPKYPETVLRRGLERVRERVAAMRADKTTPDTRLADDPLPFNPAASEPLLELMAGGIPRPKAGSLLHSRLRYFDPVARRAGLPPDVGALLEGLDGDSVTFTLVNINTSEARQVVVQAGAYAEHTFGDVQLGETKRSLEDSAFRVVLAPGCGIQFTASMKRYVNVPTLAFPWDRTPSGG
jgi:hypothetical protein